MSNLRFSIYKHKLVYRDLLLTRCFIVIKDEDGNIVAWTDFHKYIRSWRSKRAIPLNSTAENRFYSIVPFLNYVFFDKYKINNLTDITAQMCQDYLNDYGLCRLPNDDEYTVRGEDTINQTCKFLIDFLEHVIDANPAMKMKKKDLYREEEVYSKSRKKYVTKKVPAFKVVYEPRVKETLRDIPDKVFKILLDEIVTNYKSILGLAILGAFAGLRPSEACNVRRADSALGSGLQFNYVDGAIEEVRIDLKKKLNLRSDLQDVGSIKKPRIQRVYPAFLDSFCQCYNIYMQYMEGRRYEEEYGAFSVNSRGKAMTYDNYYLIFQDAVAAAQEKMKSNDDPEIVNYGFLLDEYRLGMHVFRHWFSVQLTLRGEDVAGLMYWRGDKSPESALTYIMNKSDLERQYTKVVNRVYDYNQWRAKKIYDTE